MEKKQLSGSYLICYLKNQALEGMQLAFEICQ